MQLLLLYVLNDIICVSKNFLLGYLNFRNKCIHFNEENIVNINTLYHYSLLFFFQHFTFHRTKRWFKKCPTFKKGSKLIGFYFFKNQLESFFNLFVIKRVLTEFWIVLDEFHFTVYPHSKKLH